MVYWNTNCISINFTQAHVPLLFKGGSVTSKTSDNDHVSRDYLGQGCIEADSQYC